MASPRPVPLSSPPSSVGGESVPASIPSTDHPQHPSNAYQDRLFAARVAQLSAVRRDLQIHLLRHKLKRLREIAASQTSPANNNNNQSHSVNTLTVTTHYNVNQAAFDLNRFLRETADTLPPQPQPSQTFTQKPNRAIPRNGFSSSADTNPPSFNPPNQLFSNSSSSSTSPTPPQTHSLSLTIPTPLPSPSRPPPLLAKLYFDQEIAAHFPRPSTVRLDLQSSSTTSLQAAIRLYHRHLFPHPLPSRPPHRGAPIHDPPHQHLTTVQARSDAAAEAANKKFRREQTFQTRTYLHGMTRMRERHAPTAPWPVRPRPPPSQPFRSPSSGYGYASYRIDMPLSGSALLRRHHLDKDLCGAGPVCRFGFQKQTNYPFRLTYNNPTTAPAPAHSASAMGNLSMIAQMQIAKRVPVEHLPIPLRQLLACSASHARGSFFRPVAHARAMRPATREYVSGHPASDDAYEIGPDGRLVQHGTKSP